LSDKCHLGFFPTPLQRLDNISRKASGHSIYIKRDDQTGLATGGNKTRKLEYLLQEAMLTGCDTLITAGAQQSNHCRQTAAAAAKFGLNCHLLLGGTAPTEYNGNLLLSKLLGAEIHFSGSNRKGERLPHLKSKLEAQGHRCYIIPYGGSNLTGALGFVSAVQELKSQEQRLGLEFDHIFFASSSGGTQAGMILGKELFGLKATLHPINIDKVGIAGTALEDLVINILKAGARLLGLKKSFSPADCQLNRNYDSSGYGKLSSKELVSLQQLATEEGILLDPVYTARAFNAMLDLIQNEIFPKESTILFWHTGGIPAVFEQSNTLLA